MARKDQSEGGIKVVAEIWWSERHAVISTERVICGGRQPQSLGRSLQHSEPAPGRVLRRFAADSWSFVDYFRLSGCSRKRSLRESRASTFQSTPHIELL